MTPQQFNIKPKLLEKKCIPKTSLRRSIFSADGTTPGPQLAKVSLQVS